ncbi:MAG: hypothetical protein J6331_05290 [Lentisphaeria bacterium]|nr:hypothetical protein [Lentisphaeria bacterium]
MAEIQILGSAAAEGIPAIFCNCRVCSKAWKNGGKDLRLRTAYKLKDTVRVDFGPDTLTQEYHYELHSERLKHLFITHSHEDHCVPDLLSYRMPGFSKVEEDNILNIYGNAGIIHKLQLFFWEKAYNYFNGDFGRFRLKLHELESYKEVVLEEEDMEFLPLPADHQLGIAAEKPQIFVIRDGASRALIANDTGFFRDEVWEFLERKKFKFDLVISDCTGGIRDIERGHMSGKYVLETKARLEKIGSVTDFTKYFINHFSHNGHATHAELEEFYNPHGIQVAYDGLTISY